MFLDWISLEVLIYSHSSSYLNLAHVVVPWINIKLLKAFIGYCVNVEQIEHIV